MSIVNEFVFSLSLCGKTPSLNCLIGLTTFFFPLNISEEKNEMHWVGKYCALIGVATEFLVNSAIFVHRSARRTTVGFAAAEIRRYAHNHRFHQDPADVLHQSKRHHGRIGGTSPGDVAS